MCYPVLVPGEVADFVRFPVLVPGSKDRCWHPRSVPTRTTEHAH